MTKKRSNKKARQQSWLSSGLLALLILLFSTGYSQSEKQDTIPLLHGAHRIGKRMDVDMNRWRGYGLGQFIHWGLYSILGGDYNGKHYNGAAEWIRSWNQLPNAVYDSLYKQFNPKDFNADKWAAMAKQMGVKYVTITTKHHDGFCLWPSKYTSYNISNTPYKKDIIKQIVDAYTKVGIDVYLYFSVMDWHNPDWRYDLKSASDTIAFNKFKKFTQSQLEEQLRMYPQIKGFWFDGTWDNSWKKSGAFSDSLDQDLKRIHPGLIIGSRLRADDYGKRHFDSNGRLMGDYEQGWERTIPETFADTHGNDWECDMTIPENGWGYAKQWMGHWKTSDELIEMLAKCVSLDGNFVLNFGPKPNGTFRQKEVADAKAIGDWMKINNTAIYNCAHVNWEKQDWGYFTTPTSQDDKVYMIVFNVPVSGALRVLPTKNILLKKAYLLDGDKQLSIEKLDGSAYFVHLPNEGQKQPFVVVLETEKGKNGKQDINKHI
ncbi:alpha-L-fucosidase [Arachidicoccus soli]|uniref:alpha-L-fucosidase n=1 Tax=Arachidicoccus soli TaxID=2341117 RepID=A0A386HR40_9BACT|nr:alpha-L-fucosidase [Arachidicoccus soli]AYD48428.1 alpha-L-fucosidase [Arachidicoccus soli]